MPKASDLLLGYRLRLRPRVIETIRHEPPVWKHPLSLPHMGQDERVERIASDARDRQEYSERMHKVTVSFGPIPPEQTGRAKPSYQCTQEPGEPVQVTLSACLFSICGGCTTHQIP